MEDEILNDDILEEDVEESEPNICDCGECQECIEKDGECTCGDCDICIKKEADEELDAEDFYDDMEPEDML